MFIVKFIFMFTLLVGAASAETERKLADEYLGIALGSTVKQVNLRIPIEECENRQTMTGCRYYGDPEKNSKYKLLDETTMISLSFENDSLYSILVFFNDSLDFSNLVALFENSYGSPIVTHKPGLVSVTTYTWENSKVINDLSRVKGTNIQGKPFDIYSGGIKSK